MSVKDHPTSSRAQARKASNSPRPANSIYPPSQHSVDQSSMKTPTRDTFGGVSGQRPLPSPSSPSSAIGSDHTRSASGYLGRSESVHSVSLTESGDVDMDDADDQEGSDTESVTGDASRPSTKKKSQRFFCTDFPPCQLSFTRSEHLARHIRKHTGERPFQCHCLRRFSRLDNLRQHAQTVHLNEDIPCDSLAATSTRFQRQIRTDRMRPPNNRARASTISSQSSHGRGHSRNWSGSSIGSVSDIASPDEGRRRPQPLAMAQTTPSRGLTVDTFAANTAGPDAYLSQYNDSPSGYSTPTSGFSATASSPMVPSGVQSPISMMSRNSAWGERLPGRRLSTPTAHNPYQPAYSTSSIQYMSTLASSTASTFSNSGSGFASPTTSVFSDVRRDSIGADPDIRRRTWHPGTYGGYGSRPATSGLSYYQTPDAPQPVAASQPAAAQAIRLPGIDSFDSVRAQPIAPPRRPPSAMDVEQASQGGSAQDTYFKPTQSGVASPRNSWGSINQGLTRLDIAHAPPEPSMSQTGIDHQPHPGLLRPVTFPYPGSHMHHKSAPAQLNVKFSQESLTASEDSAAARKKKRHAWYNGPLPSAPESQPSFVPVRTSPEGSSSSDGVPTPSSNYVAEYHPAIVHGNGYIEAQPPGMPMEDPHKANNAPRAAYPLSQLGGLIPPPSHVTLPTTRPGEMDRLDALVAAATSEKQVVERR